MHVNTFVFMGRPGSGKGTQARLLSEKVHYPVLASGDMFRTFAKEATPVARRVKAVMDRGELLPPWIATYVFHREVFKHESSEGIILDGFARKLPEARVLLETFEWFDRSFRVFYLRTEKDTVVDRIEKRFHLEHRSDDEKPDERMREFEEHTRPALEFLESEGMVIPIDGEQSIEMVHQQILGHVQELGGTAS